MEIYKNTLFVTAESKVQHSIAMQEDSWDSDWDLHENLFRDWTEIKENASHR